MSKSSRNTRTTLLRPTTIAAAVAALPGAPATPPALTMVDLTGSSDASPASVKTSGTQVLELKLKYGEVTKEHVRQVFDFLHAQPDIVKGSLWHTLSGSLRERLGESVTNQPYISGLMQQLGLLRHWGRNVTTTWQVLDPTFFEEVVTDHWFSRAVVNLAKADQMVEEVRLLKERKEELEQELEEAKVASAGVAAPSAIASTVTEELNPQLMAQVAGLVEEVTALRAQTEEVEALRAQVAEQVATIAEMDRRLAEPVKPGPAEMAEYLKSFLAKKA
jgi:hypothetical protein